MNSPLLSPEDVADLGMALRDVGYGVGPDQCIAAQRLIVTLAAEGPRFSDRRGLQTWLAPIFCCSPAEQEAFPTHYEEWLTRHGEAVARPGSVAGAESAPGVPPKGRTSQLRRAIAAFIVATGVVGASFVVYQISHELMSRAVKGKVVDQNGTPLPEAAVRFRGKRFQADPDGGFTLTFRLLDLPTKVTANDKEGFADSIELNANDYTRTITLRVGPPPPPSAADNLHRLDLTANEVDFLRQTPYVPPPVQPQEPTISFWQRVYRRHYRDFFIVAASMPFLFTVLWILWMHLPRLQLIRWKSQGGIRLDSLRVKGSNIEFFASPGFRRIAQQLRRHRLVESSDLDPDRTVVESANLGGWFTPVYLWRKRLPDYLILIDRAGFRDFQGRLIEQFVNNLRIGKVEIDCYDYYSDPRTCFLTTPSESLTARQERSAAAKAAVNHSSLPADVSVLVEENQIVNSTPLERFSLEDLRAKYPNHNLFIFGDGSGFFSPLSGRPHPWVEHFSQWSFRAFLVPERMLAADMDRRTRVLQDTGFLVLSATERGLSTAVEVLDGGDAERADFGRRERSDSGDTYPSLLNGDDLRWLSDLPPKPSQVSLLIAQLRGYLGQETFKWFCACAVYPELLWDLTLYLGDELRFLGPDEQRLGLLLRLPWFRHGSMPDWLRNRLVDIIAPPELEAVRNALWRLLDTALNGPLDGFELSYAKDEKAQPAGARVRKQWLRRLLLNFIRTEQPTSALRDYVFLSVLRGRKLGKGLPLPDKLRRLWGRFGQPRRPVIQVVSGVLATVAVSAAMYHYRPAPLALPNAKLPDGVYPLPKPTGPLPYHLSLDQIVRPAIIKSAQAARTLVFQVTGDTGGVKNPTPQRLVADAMVSQFRSSDSAYDPAFLYLLGDLIYYNGELKDYYSQFYDPYRNYSAPIVAIPGNHDGDPVQRTQSLEPFMRNFCAPGANHTPEAGDVNRTSMRQPNSYWTLDTPVATIIGLYTNVPNQGFVDDSQQAWLVSELRNAPANKALIVAMHHPIYSAASPSGSEYLGGVLDHAMAAAGRAPDLVLAAHANNYQRFTRVLGTVGRAIPYVISGGGGYFNLHRLPVGTKVPVNVSPGVTLNAFEDGRHGFLRLTATAKELKGEYFAVNESFATTASPALIDSFTIDLIGGLPGNKLTDVGLDADRAAVLSSLSLFEHAYNARDLAAISKIWPTMPAKDRRVIGASFKAAIALSLSLRPGVPRFSPDRLIATVDISASPDFLRSPYGPIVSRLWAYTCQLKKDNLGSWVIASLVQTGQQRTPDQVPGLDIEPRSEESPNSRTPRNGVSGGAGIAGVGSRPEGNVFDNWNNVAVQNHPLQPTTFTLNRPYRITRLSNYHWNNGRGANPAKRSIRLRGFPMKIGDIFSDPAMEWPVSASSGQAGAPNVNWECTPNITLPAGSYVVVDPDPDTWSYNAASGNAGFSRVEGYPADSEKPAPGPGTSPANHFSGTIVPTPTNWAALQVTVDGSSAKSGVDKLGSFDLSINGANGDRVRLKVFADGKLLYDDYQTLPGPVTLTIPTSLGSKSDSATQQQSTLGSYSVHGRVQTAEGNPVSRAEVRILGDASGVTSDSGEFYIRSPHLNPGDPITFSVVGWVIVDPYVGSPGRTYLPKGQDPISIRVVHAGDPRLLSGGSSSGKADQPESTSAGRWPATGVEALTQDSERVAVAGYDNSISVWTVLTDPPHSLFQLSGHTARIRSIAWSPNQQSLASVGDDKSIRVWDVGGRRLERTMMGSTPFGSVAWSPDGTLLAAGGDDGSVGVWNVASGTELRRLSVTTAQGPVIRVQWNYDGKELQAKYSGTTITWDVATGREVSHPNKK